MNAPERVSTDLLMEEVRERIRERYAEREDGLVFEAVERLHAAIARKAVLVSELVRDDVDRGLNTFIRFESHRNFGWLINFVKRRILFPLNFWLFQFTRDNFERQQEINRELLAAIEVLAADNLALERRLAELEQGSVGSEPPGP